jgi:hypothetical protein
LKHQTETVGTLEKAVCFENTGDCFIFRICENSIPLDLIEEHPALCFRVHQYEYQNFCATQRLIETNQSLIEQFLNYQFRANGAPQHLFPALYLHLL